MLHSDATQLPDWGQHTCHQQISCRRRHAQISRCAIAELGIKSQLPTTFTLRRPACPPACAWSGKGSRVAYARRRRSCHKNPLTAKGTTMLRLPAVSLPSTKRAIQEAKITNCHDDRQEHQHLVLHSGTQDREGSFRVSGVPVVHD